MNGNGSGRPEQPGRPGSGTHREYPPADDTDLPIDIVLDRLSVVSRSGSTWSARCPHHHDNRPSLSITETPEGVVLLHCHYGCSAEEVLGAIDLTFADLYPSPYALEFGVRRGNYSAGAYLPRGGEEEPVIDYEALADFHRASRPGKGLAPLAKDWGLPLAAVKRLEVGTHRDRWVIPERNSRGRIIGIAFRHPDGSKSCLKGSRRGLVIPTDTRPTADQPLYLAEGASDTAALVSVGVQVVGRPAAALSGLALESLVNLLICSKFANVVVLADRDDAGEAGAASLASRLKQRGGPNWWVQRASPRRRFKDIREQVLAGRWEQGLLVWEVLE